MKLLKWLPPAGIALILVGFGIAINAREFTEVSGLVSILGVILFLSVFLAGQSANLKFYINVAVATIFVLGSCVVIYMLIDRQNAEWDFTQNKRFSLAPQTTTYLDALDSDVKIYGFFSNFDMPRPDAERALLERYEKHSPRVALEFVDPVKESARMRELKEYFDTDITSRMIIIEKVEELEEGQTPRFKKIMRGEESPVTNALMEVTQESQAVVYALTGHGEKTIEFGSVSNQENSISKLKDMLADQGFKIKTLNWQGEIPADCSILLVASPKSDLFTAEMESIKKYLDSGKRGLFYFDPPERMGEELKNWATLLGNYGIELTENWMCDRKSMALRDPTIIIAAQFDKFHEVSKQFEGMNPAFYGVRALEKSGTVPDGFSVTELIKTGLPNAPGSSWTISYEDLLDVQKKGKMSIPPESQLKSLPIALSSAETLEDGARLIVIGDASGISDAALAEFPAMLALLSMNWLAGQSERIAIPPKTVEDTMVYVSDSTMSVVFILVVVALPLAVFFGGLSYTMLRRRTR
jgi:hypothetical protein